MEFIKRLKGLFKPFKLSDHLKRYMDMSLEELHQRLLRVFISEIEDLQKKKRDSRYLLMWTFISFTTHTADDSRAKVLLEPDGLEFVIEEACISKQGILIKGGEND